MHIDWLYCPVILVNITSKLKSLKFTGLQYKPTGKMEKQCIECKEVKSLEDFHLLKNGKYGRNPRCKPCRSTKRKEISETRECIKKESKRCPGCKEVKEIIAFNKDMSASDGRQTYCKPCGTKNLSKWGSSFNGYIVKLFKDLKSNARRRNIKIEIDKEDIIQLYEKQKGLCALSGEKMTHKREAGTQRKNPNHIYNISVDRINPRNHYTVDNIQLVCNRMNTIKWDLDQDLFIDLCKKVAALHT
ncbi:hypothetical protein DRO61_04745 [Candidatus Bathyarchaeota archaeon]|nr:MAG: hypothetical protein DRO61_04745 [Candidatus Bathyarchaeota archaeon]